MGYNFVPLDIPPGIYRNGTEYQAKARYYDMNLVRFENGAIKPHGGWRVKSDSAVTGKGRALIGWKTDLGATFGAIGTESHLYAMARDGTLTDITPAGFTSGRASATQPSGGGYGSGAYGAGLYGSSSSDGSEINDATVWSLDTFGQYLLGTTAEDGNIFVWPPGDPAATAISDTDAPTDCRALVVTPEGFVMALRIGRVVQWSDQRDEHTWTSDPLNQAGDIELQTTGRLMLGKGAKDYTLILTDLDAWVANYIGGTLIYSFPKVGDGCGAISQACAAAIDARCVWMGRNGFFLCNGGFVEPLPCDVQDYVFSDINRSQVSKVTCTHSPEYGEVTWRYCSASSTEIDRFLTWKYKESPNIWEIGKLPRLSAIPRGVFSYPLAVGDDGYVYEHEVGWEYDDLTPYLRSGPMEIGVGNNVATIMEMFSDQALNSSVQVTFTTRFNPGGTQRTYGPYTATRRIRQRITGRQIEITYEGLGGDFRIGNFRADVRMGGAR